MRCLYIYSTNIKNLFKHNSEDKCKTKIMFYEILKLTQGLITSYAEGLNQIPKHI